MTPHQLVTLFWKIEIVVNKVTGGQEIKFYEIKTGVRKILKTCDQQNLGFFMSSKFLIVRRSLDRAFFMRSKLEQFVSHKFDHEIETQKSIIGKF